MKMNYFLLPGLLLTASLIGATLADVSPKDGQTNTEDVIRTRQLCIVDETGQTRISLGMVEGSPAIRLLDRDGACRVRVIAGDSGSDPSAAMQFSSKDQKTHLTVGLEYFYPMMKMYYDGGDARILLGVGSKGEPGMAIGMSDGTSRLTLGVDSEGAPLIRLYDKDSKPHSKEAKIIWQAP